MSLKFLLDLLGSDSAAERGRLLAEQRKAKVKRMLAANVAVGSPLFGPASTACGPFVARMLGAQE